MQVARSLASLEEMRAGLSGSIGFVPTMGALHAGHLSLVGIARNHSDHVIVSIYVNPTQFAPGEDFDAYPRDIDADLAQLKAAAVDLVYLPETQDIYPNGQDSLITAGAAGAGLESEFRPHFFDGVVNVVNRLFTQVKPDIAVFGEKDYQQLAVIREMVAGQDMGIEIFGGETTRDAHGLALSSRNAYLSADELTIARQLNVILHGGAPTPEALIAAGFDKVDYVAKRWGRVLAAAWIGKTRLIDNVPAP